MKNNKKEKLKCRLLQILLIALRVNLTGPHILTYEQSLTICDLLVNLELQTYVRILGNLFVISY